MRIRTSNEQESNNSLSALDFNLYISFNTIEEDVHLELVHSISELRVSYKRRYLQLRDVELFLLYMARLLRSAGYSTYWLVGGEENLTRSASYIIENSINVS